MRTPSQTLRRTSRGLAAAGVAALVASSVLVAAPANAVETITYTVPGLQAPDFVVPANVSSITYEVVGGAGGQGGGADSGGLGGDPANVFGTFPVTAGDTIEVWVAGVGQDGLDPGGNPGDGGDGGIGFVEGGDGGRCGFWEFDDEEFSSFCGSGAGGGGSSAILLNTNLVASAAGGGGGGGHGLQDLVWSACTGGAGGDAGLAGDNSNGGLDAPYFRCPIATGGTPGTGPEDPGGDATDVTPNGFTRQLIGGGGGGGAGDGNAGAFNNAFNGLFARTAGGGGGAGGASFLNLAVSPDAQQVIEILPLEATGDGWVTLSWVVTLPATGPVNVPLFAGGALLLLLAGGTLFLMRRRAEQS